MAKIAIAVERALAQRRAAGSAGGATPRDLASGDGWRVADVVCTFGPHDRRFEEQHQHVSIAVVAAGSFAYQSPLGRELMTPGSMMLGVPGQCFECGHEHGSGDRCVSFWFSRDYFDRIASDVSGRANPLRFRTGRVPALRDTASLVARACVGALDASGTSWEELGLAVAARVAALVTGVDERYVPQPLNGEARAARVVRMIEHELDGTLTVRELAARAALSPFHFLRTFEQVTGVTPHQFVRRARLREAAIRLALDPDRVVDVALESGFGDVSNFNRAFRSEFGQSPLVYRAAHPERSDLGRIRRPARESSSQR